MKDVVCGKEKYPEDLIEERLELNAAPATRLHMLDFLKAIEENGKPVADTDTFTMALNDYRQSGGGGYSMLRGAPLVYAAAMRALTSGERMPISSCWSTVRNFLPIQRKM